MAQGGAKLKKNTKVKREKKGVTKRGAKRIAPKQPALIKQRAMDKKLTAQINKSIERQMAVKANAVGKLTIMKKLADEKTDDVKVKRSSNNRLT